MGLKEQNPQFKAMLALGGWNSAGSQFAEVEYSYDLLKQFGTVTV